MYNTSAWKHVIVTHSTVLPSFEVNLKMEQNFVLLKDEEFVFTISAM